MIKDINSSVINDIEYKEADLTLIVNFTNGSRYAYDGVPAEVVQSLLTAPSSGQMFNKEIRNSYRGTKLG